MSDSKSKEARYQRVLSSQLKMNKETWEKLESHGISQGTEVILEFSFDAPDKKKAVTLKSYLNDETDYAVRIDQSKNQSCRVIGKTMKTQVSLDILNKWVNWMVAAGKKCDCLFDGWGTEI